MQQFKFKTILTDSRKVNKDLKDSIADGWYIENVWYIGDDIFVTLSKESEQNS